MFKQRKGINPAALLIGSSVLLAALSPEVRNRVRGFMAGRMNKEDSQQMKKDSQQQTAGTSDVGNMIKQAFGGETQTQQQQSHQQQQQVSPAERKQPHYAEPIHFDESAVNVMNDNTIMNMIEDLEPGSH
ncbi:hypothetical protein [Bacillus atrophaeus]|uniref:hypothetical protein n=1 Tax=Bacillus atrophaeus TaxID=1452 RepID=UPI0012392033|nr:hypothetical protein [Bacillus atrophaeus]KAA6454243.1 hypothetical protein DX926_07480 [Bacillus atrophaeus]